MNNVCEGKDGRVHNLFTPGQVFGERKAGKQGQGPGGRLCEPRSGVWSILRVTNGLLFYRKQGFQHDQLLGGMLTHSAVWKVNLES